MGPHVWTHFGPALSAPIGVIHWAATDTATRWSAYMEGAVDAGERAAHRGHRRTGSLTLDHTRQEISMLSEASAGREVHADVSLAGSRT